MNISKSVQDSVASEPEHLYAEYLAYYEILQRRRSDYYSKGRESEGHAAIDDINDTEALPKPLIREEFRDWWRSLSNEEQQRQQRLFKQVSRDREKTVQRIVEVFQRQQC